MRSQSPPGVGTSGAAWLPLKTKPPANFAFAVSLSWQCKQAYSRPFVGAGLAGAGLEPAPTIYFLSPISYLLPPTFSPPPLRRIPPPGGLNIFEALMVKIGVVKLSIMPAGSQQLIVGALFENGAMAEHDDPIHFSHSA
ncbi:MAG: hypothetical protein KatS3mg056_1338 [Chloroflexus sp.]|nr:MAG: hypothetical protein KatS3mg056_1338 [Chloroflexus sp.]